MTAIARTIPELRHEGRTRQTATDITDALMSAQATLAVAGC